MFTESERSMKEILEKWEGKFVVDNEVCTDLHDLKVKDGEDFHVTLLSKRRKVDEEEDC